MSSPRPSKRSSYRPPTRCRRRDPAPAATCSKPTSNGSRSSKRSPTHSTASARAYAIQAGRELRIIVKSEEVSDNEAVWLSKDIAKRIEKEVQYPGEIKVTVIREIRAVGFAR